ncbi:alpha-taxilin [Fopius arisanus]|uniref:Alpha-taxilin n=1 Tax=Fopius arisanus TaxID=64838 RepID=A0A9R1TGB5_9HYME|nr:PREDICTED: alpha-taxilin [Fopius arisanus]XP_011309874.1 PREDICTED: alpha-taxilin [Fopius arisanus]
MDIEKETIDAMRAMLEDSPQVPDENATGSNHGKKHSKQKKRDSASLYGNEVAEILQSSATPEQKLSTVCNKYSEMLHANRKLMMAYKMAEVRISKMQHQNEQCQQQRSKAILARSRLENLCRELQKLNKAQKEEIDLKLKLDEEKRKEISATFQSAFAEMSTLTNQNSEKNTKMREENLEMREKIKSVRERIELSEQQLEKVRQQAQVKLQLAEAKMAKVKLEMTAEKETLLKEKQQLLLKLTEYQVRVQELQAVEVGLRSQISMYTEKYDDFQSALIKSNEVVSGFNEEMQKMSKKIIEWETKTTLWKKRWEKSHEALLEMATDKQAREAEMSKLTDKYSILQELCKAFQRERAELLYLSAQCGKDPHKYPKIAEMDMQKVAGEALTKLLGENDTKEEINESDEKLKTQIPEVSNSPTTESNNDQDIVDKLSGIKVSDSEAGTEEKCNSLGNSHDDNQSASNLQCSTDKSTNCITTTEDIQGINESENSFSVEKNVPLSEVTGETSPSPLPSADETQRNNSEASAPSDETQKTNSGKKHKQGKKKKR